jgi:hypothetical protein
LREAEILNEVVILLENIKNRQPCSGDSNMGKKRLTVCFDQYQMEKYEKIEFDMNTIDSALKNKLFRGMEFILIMSTRLG